MSGSWERQLASLVADNARKLRTPVAGGFWDRWTAEFARQNISGYAKSRAGDGDERPDR